MKKKQKKIAETHPDLRGMEISVNEFGEIISNISVERLNDFLDRNLTDKKLDEDGWVEKKTKKITPKPAITKKLKSKK
ncbi:MAG: hypothetical protein LH473_00185 [Chitinophagales bacterium]|nr:hypothetical protein [Chitinophagales bacterium]